MSVKSLKLKYLDLIYSKLTNHHLQNTLNLDRLLLDGCDDLVEIQMPAESLKLKYLNLVIQSWQTLTGPTSYGSIPHPTKIAHPYNSHRLTFESTNITLEPTSSEPIWFGPTDYTRPTIDTTTTYNRITINYPTTVTRPKHKYSSATITGPPTDKYTPHGYTLTRSCSCSLWPSSAKSYVRRT